MTTGKIRFTLFIVVLLFGAIFSAAAGEEGIYNVYLPIIWSPSTPTAFDKSSPMDGAIDQNLELELWWIPSEWVTSYEYCIDTTNDNSCSNWISTGTNNYVGLSKLQQGTTYYWQVRAWNDAYGPTYANGSASAYWSFTTVIMTPGAFNKLSPENGYDGTTMSPVLSWNTSVNATKYEYCYDTSNDNSCSNWVSTGTNSYVGLSGLQSNTTYYWQVRSWNGTYGPTYANGSASAFWHFKTLGSGVWIMDNCSLYDNNGQLTFFVCEVYNNTTLGVNFFTIEVDLYDDSGNWIGDADGTAPLIIIHSQETGCVTVWFESLPNLAYLYYEGYYYETSLRRPSLSISNRAGSPIEWGWFETSGIITNNSAITLDVVFATASLYINNGLVVGCDSGSVNSGGELAPGQQGSFLIYSSNIPDPYAITRYKLQADGFRYALNTFDELNGEKLNALGGNKTMRLMD